MIYSPSFACSHNNRSFSGVLAFNEITLLKDTYKPGTWSSEMNSVNPRTILFLLFDVQPRAHLVLLVVSHAFSPQILSQARVKWLENLMQTTTTTSHMTYGNLAEMRNPTSVDCLLTIPSNLLVTIFIYTFYKST